MKRGRRAWVFLLIPAAAVLLAIGWIAVASGEPAYNGKSLTYWLDALSNSRYNTPEEQEATQAIRTMGTNALPFLLKMESRKDSALKRWLLRTCSRQKMMIPLHEAQHYHAKSTWGFAALGKSAKPAVPDLITLLKDPDRQVRAMAAHNLSSIGPDAEDAIPSLILLLDERNNGIAIVNALSALGQIHKQPQVVLPRLVEFLNGDRKDWGNYATPALVAIGQYRRDAKHLAPTIATFLDGSKSGTKFAAEAALLEVDPQYARETLQARERP
jgi:hypothetical protein